MTDADRERDLRDARTDAELSDLQRRWTPDTAGEAYAQWPAAGKIELAGDAIDFLSDNGGWDWRSVAMAARAFPGWRIELRGPGHLAVRQPEERRPLPEA